jgi:hypothetical protein
MVYQCEKCNKLYKTNKCLRQHIQIKHSRIESLQCVKCDKHFSNKLSLKQHVYSVHPSKLHSCSFCGSSFKASWICILSECGYFCVVNIYFLNIQKKHNRDRHITCVHTGEKSFMCKICPSKFSRAELLRGRENYECTRENIIYNLCFNI